MDLPHLRVVEADLIVVIGSCQHAAVFVVEFTEQNFLFGALNMSGVLLASVPDPQGFV